MSGLLALYLSVDNERLKTERDAIAAQRDHLQRGFNAAIANLKVERERSVALGIKHEEARAENRQLREVLQYLNRKGSLGLDVHARIDAALASQSES